MASMLNKSFVRGVIRRVHDCSNPIQLGAYLKRYESYVFTPGIQKIFLSRIEFFKKQFVGDKLMLDKIEDLLDSLETEIKIANVCGPKQLMYPMAKGYEADQVNASHRHNINIDYIQHDNDQDNCEYELDLLRQVFNMTNGNKVVICRILGIDNSILNKKVNQYKLKTYLNEIRRDFRSQAKNKE